MTTDDSNSSARPRGAPRWVTLDGIAEGRIGDQGLLAEAVRGLDGLGLGRFELERDGGRFSVLPDNTQRAGAGFDEARQQDLLTHLAALARAAKGPLESTLRCTMVFDEQCTETLFRGAAAPPAGPGIEPLTRVRPRQTGDAPSAPPPLPWHQRWNRREVWFGVPVVALLLALAAWQAGVIDRVFAPDAGTLSIDPGAFGDLLTAEIENAWGDYAVTIIRGPGYPVTGAEWDARLSPATTETDRLHATVVREGRELYVQLRDAADRVLAEAPAPLRALVTARDAAVAVRLPGNMAADRVQLSVTRRAPK